MSPSNTPDDEAAAVGIALVPADRIEEIVGVKRHQRAHYGRAVSAERTVYILHSQRCKDSGIDLRECLYSTALKNGIDSTGEWRDKQDVAVMLGIWEGRLVALKSGKAAPDA